jgi:glycosyltransferase involved in cell wall biosynthesis
MQKITHLMPVRNGERYLKQAWRGILENFEFGDEVIIINDGSTDQTSNLLKRISGSFPDLRIIETKSNGIVSALNTGFNESNNSWVARYDVDDIYPMHRISTQRRLISDDVSVIFADYRMHLENGFNMGLFPSPVTDFASRVSLLRSQQTAHSVALINRDHFNLAGGYLSEDFPTEDLGLWIRISQFGKILSVPEVLMKYRLSNSSTSGSRQIEARKVRQNLINKLPSILKSDASLDSLILETLDIYKSTSLEKLRIILFLRNLELAESLGLLPKTGLKFSKFKLASQGPLDVSQAIWHKTMRDLYRKLC